MWKKRLKNLKVHHVMAAVVTVLPVQALLQLLTRSLLALSIKQVLAENGTVRKIPIDN
jgi:hypothetical protein